MENKKSFEQSKAKDEVPHPLFPTIYGLNKSWSKKILVGLEYDKFGDEYYKPSVRLLNDDFKGIRFTISDWAEFRNIFEDISKYLRGGANELLDHKYYGKNWTLKFVFTHGEKGIQIEENHGSCNGAVVKKYVRGMALKKVTFDTLSEHLWKCIEDKLNYLQSISKYASCVAHEILDFLTTEAALQNDAQIQMYNPNIVKDLARSFTIDRCEIFAKKIVIEENFKKLSIEDTFVLFYEIVSLQSHMIAEELNSKVLKLHEKQ